MKPSQSVWMRRGSMAALILTLMGGVITTGGYIHGLESAQTRQAAKFAADRAVMQDKIEDLEDMQRWHTRQVDEIYQVLITAGCQRENHR